MDNLRSVLGRRARQFPPVWENSTGTGDPCTRKAEGSPEGEGVPEAEGSCVPVAEQTAEYEGSR